VSAVRRARSRCRRERAELAPDLLGIDVAYQPFQNLRQGVARDVLEQDLMPCVACEPEDPPTKTSTASTALPSTFALVPSRPMSANGVIAAAGRTPGPVDLTGFRGALSPRAPARTASARLFVSITARLQNSMPVQLTSPRMISDGSYRRTFEERLGRQVPDSPASGTLAMITFWSGVRRISPVP